jgi:hypothetical protein
MFFVHTSCRDSTGVTRAIGTAVMAKDERDGSVEHKQSRVKLVRVCITMHIWLDLAFAKVITLAPNVGFKLGSIHRH